MKVASLYQNMGHNNSAYFRRRVSESSFQSANSTSIIMPRRIASRARGNDAIWLGTCWVISCQDASVWAGPRAGCRQTGTCTSQLERFWVSSWGAGFCSWTVANRLAVIRLPQMVYCAGCRFSIFTASNVACALPCRTASTTATWPQKNSGRKMVGLRLRSKSLRLLMATAARDRRGFWQRGPCHGAKRGIGGRKGIETAVQPASSVAFSPGVPDSIKSCASKCERVDRATPQRDDRQMLLAPKRLQADIEGCRPKNPSRSSTEYAEY